MPDKPLYIESTDVGQDKPTKDFTDRYDAEVGKYKISDGGKPTSAGATTTKLDPTPFTLTK